MLNQYARTELIFGKDAMARLFDSKVAVFGIGGVGGYAVEALTRSGVGRLDLYDYDKISPTNLNRQIHATRSNIGEFKVDAAKKRILDINPDALINTFRMFYLPDTSQQVELAQYDYVVDAIDTISGKIELVIRSYECAVPIISAMSAGNKVDAAAFEVADLFSTSVCPLAKVMRHELRKRGIPKLKVVYSKESAISPIADMPTSCKTNCVCPAGTTRKCDRRRQIPGSNAFVPAVAGLIIAGEVVKDLTGKA